MRYILNDLEKIKKNLAGKYLFLFLDCDGTLAHIVDTPDKAVISPETKRLLNSLAENKNYKVAIISGRALADIKEKVGLKNIIYSGNHGFQIEGPKVKHEMAVPLNYKNVLRRIKIQLEDKLSGIKGVFVEDKKLSLALHFRLADKRQIPFIKTVFHESVILYLVRNKIKISPGKKILEIMPPVHWNKGKIVLWLLARQEALSKNGKIVPIYIGDDLTDEDAFKVLKNRGLTIFVGSTNSSHAKYYVKDVKGVYVFLKWILNNQGEKQICQN
ncbi:MAG: trehalose-phosphatase [Candidatus Omnitrophica bacterium]|nr:trehalose-phosphatase [Candidatus Omnitrophota bacterium]